MAAVAPTASAPRYLSPGLISANLWVAFGAFLLAIVMGLYQTAERSGLFGWLESAELYFASTSTHGVLMAFVLTTFFNMGFGFYVAATSLKRPLWNLKLAWWSFWIALAGVVFAAYTLLTGQASVMYTFYPPQIAHSLFYLGLVLVIVGSWVWCLQMLMCYSGWKRANPGQPVPLAMYGVTANTILWIWTSIGVATEVLFQLLPLSLGLIDTIDVGLARTLFAWTLHPIVYFWLFPAYIAMYTILPKIAGGRLFSDEMARIAFIMLMVISLPIGFHHLYMDPFQAAGWKLLHAFGTFMVVLPTLLTGFTVIASLEIAGRLNGGTGLFGWIGALPWRKPMVTAAGLALLMLTVGGFGGLINASYAMNSMVHNTAWVTGHFHLIFGGSVVIMYFAIAYCLWPKLVGKSFKSSKALLWQLWLWFIGMLVLTIPWHVLGLLGQPRRISTAIYDSPLVQQWQPFAAWMVVGGVILTLSTLLFAWNLVLGWRGGAEPHDPAGTKQYAEPVHPVVRLPRLLNGFAFWNWVILVYLIASYGYPILQFFLMQTHGAVPWSVL